MDKSAHRAQLNPQAPLAAEKRPQRESEAKEKRAEWGGGCACRLSARLRRREGKEGREKGSEWGREWAGLGRSGGVDVG